MGKKENELNPNDAVCTPPEIFEPCLRALGVAEFDLDPCSHPDALLPAKSHVLLPQYIDGNPNLARVTYGDGLAVDWSHQDVFVNPPYSQLRYGVATKKHPQGKYPWLGKLATEAARGIAFIPVRTSSGWWHECILNCPQAHLLVLLRGRVKHVGHEHHSPFHQALVVYNVFSSKASAPSVRQVLRSWREAFPSAFIIDLVGARGEP